MHVTAYQYKSPQRWIAARNGGCLGGPCIFTEIQMAINFTGSFYVSGIFPSMIFASPLGVSGNWHFV